MSSVVLPGVVALVLGGVVTLVFGIFITGWQYRRYGGLNLIRTLTSLALITYVFALATYTMLPLPETTSAWCSVNAVTKPQLVPFQFVNDIINEAENWSIRGILTNPAVQQVVYNVFLFIPFGVFARRYFNWRIGTSILAGFLTSAAIEFTQLTALYGLFDCAYRLADVDDLILNTAGTLVGVLIAPGVFGWIPIPGQLEKKTHVARPVSRVRRLFGMLIDWSLFIAFSSIASAITAIYTDVSGNIIPAAANTTLVFLAPGIAIMVLPPLLSPESSTLGQRAMWLRPVWAQPNQPGPHRAQWRSFLRPFAGGGASWVVLFWLSQLGLSVVSGIAGVLALLIVVVTVAAVLIQGGSSGLSAHATRSRFIDRREDPTMRML